MGSPHGNNMPMRNMTLAAATRLHDRTTMTREVDSQGHQAESVALGERR